MSNYNIYPSLLDKFQDFLDYELATDAPWNKVSETAHKKGLHLDKEVGDYILSADEMAAKIEVELINQINRCEKEPCEAADAGTCFNEVVDCLIKNKATDRTDMKISSLRRATGEPYAIMAEMNGFTFYFDIDLCKEVANYFKGAMCQYFIEGDLPTNYGNVHLYGYMDEWIGDVIYDIKTTSMYDFGKFERKNQKFVYPYCAVQSGLIDNIREFEYTVIKWGKKYDIYGVFPITVKCGECFREVYTYNHKEASAKLKQICERFIEWLNYRRDYITDNRIFGGENPENYKGIKIEKL